MGWLINIVIICMLVAFNLFAADAMMRMRTDIQIMRKSMSDGSPKRSSPVVQPKANESLRPTMATPPSPQQSVSSSQASTPRASTPTVQSAKVRNTITALRTRMPSAAAAAAT
jgi:hypothetical protein